MISIKILTTYSNYDKSVFVLQTCNTKLKTTRDGREKILRKISLIISFRLNTKDNTSVKLSPNKLWQIYISVECLCFEPLTYFQLYMAELEGCDNVILAQGDTDMNI